MSAGRLPDHDTDSSGVSEVVIDVAGLSDNVTDLKCEWKFRSLADSRARTPLCGWVKGGNVDCDSKYGRQPLECRNRTTKERHSTLKGEWATEFIYH